MGLTSTGQLLSRWKHRDGMGSKMCQGKLSSQGKLLCSVVGAECRDAMWWDIADTSSVGSFKGVRRTGYCDRIYVSKTIRCSSRHMLQRVTMTLLRDAWGCIEWLEWSTGNACVVTTLSLQVWQTKASPGTSLCLGRIGRQGPLFLDGIVCLGSTI